MRYLGGKSRIAKKLAARIREIVPDAPAYWDPFCGGLSMSVALSAYAPVLASDACAPLIALYEAVRDGWVPPSEVDRETYATARALPDSDPMKAFCGFACSFSGLWFQAYDGAKTSHVMRTRTKGELICHNDPAGAAAKGLVRDVPRVADFARCSWLDIAPAPTDAVLYLDPPYAGTTGYAGAPPFDSASFLARVREWSAFAHIFVSEYSFPLGEIAWSATSRARGLARVETQKLERLYYIAKGSL